MISLRYRNLERCCSSHY